MQGKGEKAGTGAKGGLCRAEGAEVPVFSWRRNLFSQDIVGPMYFAIPPAFMEI